jgi:hypothetical protein
MQKVLIIIYTKEAGRVARTHANLHTKEVERGEKATTTTV